MPFRVEFPNVVNLVFLVFKKVMNTYNINIENGSII